MAKQQDLIGKTSKEAEAELKKLRDVLDSMGSLSPREVALALRELPQGEFERIAQSAASAARSARTVQSCVTAERLAR